MLDNDAGNTNGAEMPQVSAFPSDVSSPAANSPVQVDMAAGNTDGAETPQVSADQSATEYFESLKTMSKEEFDLILLLQNQFLQLTRRNRQKHFDTPLCPRRERYADAFNCLSASF